MSDMRYVERQIDQVTYPAKLSAPVKRLMAAKLDQLLRDYNQQRDKLWHSRNNISAAGGVTVDVAELSATQQERVTLLDALTKRVAEITDALKAEGITIDYNKRLWRSMLPEEIKQKENEITNQLALVEADYKTAQKRLWDLSIKLAEEQIALVQSKIKPELVTEINSIGSPALLPAGEQQ